MDFGDDLLRAPERAKLSQSPSPIHLTDLLGIEYKKDVFQLRPGADANRS